MRAKLVLMAALAVAIGYGTAGAVPWPGDDTGTLTTDKTKSKCEVKASKNVGKLVASIIKCTTKLVDGAFKAKPPFDEQACEAAAETKFTTKTPTADCPCVDDAGIIGIAEPVLNSSTNLVYCDSAGAAINTLPDNGAAQITGFVPSTKDILKAEDKIQKNVGKYVGAYLKCHQQMAAGYQKDPSILVSLAADEETCEANATTSFNVTVQGITGAAGCENILGVVATTGAQLEGGNFLTFCESPSGAFVQ